ncbi:hypothetical protein GM658_22410 [Pseudoduganella eburnea]|uniref:Uncharacterized protein n=1 Tax=Massilia eburnea TaxID=1776165 RepID=A0A6L6QMQ1_9BURK|nr:hypothetical protein [Massilia eburnea]MTW13364.1 hypothetical protein [Massilia eburnea]
MSTTPDPVVHMSELEKFEQRFDLKLERLENKILRLMLAQTLTLVGAMAALKLFG